MRLEDSKWKIEPTEVDRGELEVHSYLGSYLR